MNTGGSLDHIEPAILNLDNWLQNLINFRLDLLNYCIEKGTGQDLVVIDMGKPGKMFAGSREMILINNPELLRQVMLNESGIFNSKSRRFEEIFKNYVPEGLFMMNSDNPDYRTRRKLAQPSFYHNMLDAYIDIFTEVTDGEIAGWIRRGSIDLETDMKKLTIKILSESIFGMDIDGDTLKESMALALDIENLIVDEMRGVIQLPEYVPTPHRIKRKNVIDKLTSIIHRIINKRREDSLEKNDLISRLIRANDESNPDRNLSDSELTSIAIEFFVAGHETSARALSWLLYELAKPRNKELLRKIRDEMKGVLGNKKLTKEDKLPLLEATIKEILRLYPPSWITFREPSRDTNLVLRGENIPVKEGTPIIISTIVTHRDSRFFPDSPDDISIGRWLYGNNEFIDDWTYLPFGGGSRICIAMSFALMEIKTVLVQLLQNSDIEVNSNNSPAEENLVSKLTLSKKCGFPEIQIKPLEI